QVDRVDDETHDARNHREPRAASWVRSANTGMTLPLERSVHAHPGPSKPGRGALPFGARDRSYDLRCDVQKGRRTTFEEPAVRHADRHGAEEPRFEDPDDHRALPPLFSSRGPIDTLAGEVDGEVKKARRVA